MSEDVKAIGEMFKARRKELNLSLREAENSTSIRVNYLQAIEEGKQEHALSSVYITGFIKQYGSFLGLDVEKMMQEYPGVFNVARERHEFAYGIGTLEVRGSTGGGVKWLPSFIWAGASALIVVLAYYFAKYLDLF